MTTHPHVRRYAAFSDDPTGGNPAGVVLEAAHLTEERLQQVAAEVGYSETAFVTGPIERDGSGAIPIRYFAPEGEVDFCGHATIALGRPLPRLVSSSRCFPTLLLLRRSLTTRGSGSAPGPDTYVGKRPSSLSPLDVPRAVRGDDRGGGA